MKSAKLRSRLSRCCCVSKFVLLDRPFCTLTVNRPYFSLSRSGTQFSYAFHSGVKLVRITGLPMLKKYSSSCGVSVGNRKIGPNSQACSSTFQCCPELQPFSSKRDIFFTYLLKSGMNSPGGETDATFGFKSVKTSGAWWKVGVVANPDPPCIWLTIPSILLSCAVSFSIVFSSRVSCSSLAVSAARRSCTSCSIGSFFIAGSLMKLIVMTAAITRPITMRALRYVTVVTCFILIVDMITGHSA
mmetsp:Transcript_41823/g.69855  ORF Transcript_41823/g.69855 Transcript_41823/m.69855 type:complete len:244 (+) Transcript_41823:2189-2920(+)